jgi:hypothetical protein
MTQPTQPYALTSQQGNSELLAAAGGNPVQVGKASFAGPVSPPANGSWSQPAWFIDQSNASNAASDSNSGADSAHPLLTVRELLRRWDTTRPLLTLATTGPTCTITFMSGTPSANDPAIFDPYLVGTQFIVTMNPAASTAPAALAGVVAKNTVTNQALNATLGAGVVVGSKVVNLTRGGSFARAFKNLGGNNWQLSQPVGQSMAAGFVVTERNDWANGDTFVVFPPATGVAGSATVFNVDLAEYMPTVLALNATFNNAPLLQGFNVGDPTATSFGFDVVKVGGEVVCFDVSFAKKGLSTSSNDFPSAWNTRFNACDIEQGFGGGNRSQATLLQAGQWLPAAGGYIDGMGLDAGYMISGGTSANTVMAAASLGEVYVDGAFLRVANAFPIGVLFTTAFNGGQPVIGGSGGFDGRGLIVYPGGAGQAVATFRCAGGLRSSPQTNMYSYLTTAGLTAVHQLALTAANLDAAAGAAGFGGYAVWPGLATFSNGSQP